MDKDPVLSLLDSLEVNSHQLFASVYDFFLKFKFNIANCDIQYPAQMR